MIEPEAVVTYIDETFPGVNHVEANGDHFFIYDPERNLPPNRQIPFATVIHSDLYDQVSQLDREGVYRLNLGVSRQTYESLFGSADASSYDLSALDVLMPHPEYGHMHYVCVLNPSDRTWERLKP